MVSTRTLCLLALLLVVCALQHAAATPSVFRFQQPTIETSTQSGAVFVPTGPYNADELYQLRVVLNTAPFSIPANTVGMTITCKYGRATWCAGDELPQIDLSGGMIIPYTAPLSGFGMEECAFSFDGYDTNVYDIGFASSNKVSFAIGSTQYVTIQPISNVAVGGTVSATVALEFPVSEEINVNLYCSSVSPTAVIPAGQLTAITTFTALAGDGESWCKIASVYTSSGNPLLDQRLRFRYDLQQFTVGAGPAGALSFIGNPTTVVAGGKPVKFTVTPNGAGAYTGELTLICSYSGNQMQSTPIHGSSSSAPATFTYTPPNRCVQDVCRIYTNNVDLQPFPSVAFTVNVQAPTKARAKFQLGKKLLPARDTRVAASFQNSCFTDEAVVEAVLTSEVEASLTANNLNPTPYDAAIPIEYVPSGLGCARPSAGSTCIFTFVPLMIRYLPANAPAMDVRADGRPGIWILQTVHDPKAVNAVLIYTLEYAGENGETGKIRMTRSHTMHVRPATSDSAYSHPFVQKTTAIDFWGEQGDLNLVTLKRASEVAVNDEFWYQPRPASVAAGSVVAAPYTVRVTKVTYNTEVVTVQNFREARSYRPVVDGLVASNYLSRNQDIYNKLMTSTELSAYWTQHSDFGVRLHVYLYADPAYKKLTGSRTVTQAQLVAVAQKYVAQVLASYA